MDLKIGVNNSGHSHFRMFVKSKVMDDLVNDIIKTSGLDITVVDVDGNIILPPGFSMKYPDDVLKDFGEYISGELLSFQFNSKPRLFKLGDQIDLCFIVSPIHYKKTSGHIGFIVGGPYIQEVCGDFEIEICDKLYKFYKTITETDIDSVISLNSTLQKVAVRIMDSYGRMIANLYEEKIRSLKNMNRLSSLYEISASLNKERDLKSVLKLVLNKSIELLEANNGSVLLFDELKEHLTIFVANGLSEEIIRSTLIKVGEGISGTVARDGKPKLLKKGVKDDKSSIQKSATLLNSAISVPLISNEEILGVLNVSGKKHDQDFEDEDQELLEALAANVSNAIRNASLNERIQRKIDELSALFDLSATIVSSLDRREVLKKIMENAIALLNAAAGSLMLFNEGDQLLEIEVGVGLPEHVIRDTKVRIGEGISGKVARERKPRLLKKGLQTQDSKSGRDNREFPSALCVPMIFQDKFIGVINVKEKNDGSNFDGSDLELLTMLAGQAAIAIENAELHNKLRDLFVNSIKALANAIEARDAYTRGHSERVTEYSVKLADYMGYDGEEIDKIRYAALLHDIGKINIKEEILNKPGKLTKEEYEIMCEHPGFGAKIMGHVKEFQSILPYMYHHHERYASGGYPDGVRGEEIPLPARIIALADAFDAMTTDRPYRKALDTDFSVNEIKKNSGTQFDPLVVEAFVRLVEAEREWIDSIIESSREEQAS
ncbi:MAG: GAF domain-containing protein [Firmicutes bacterium]|nr:GAF domain-containing protein [Bacillota bacterium]